MWVFFQNMADCVNLKKKTKYENIVAEKDNFEK